MCLEWDGWGLEEAAKVQPKAPVDGREIEAGRSNGDKGHDQKDAGREVGHRACDAKADHLDDTDKRKEGVDREEHDPNEKEDGKGDHNESREVGTGRPRCW